MKAGKVGRSQEKAVLRPDRANKTNVSGWFPVAVKGSIRLIQAQHPGRSQQELLAEALNLLFEKYGVPQVPVSPADDD